MTSTYAGRPSKPHNSNTHTRQDPTYCMVSVSCKRNLKDSSPPLPPTQNRRSGKQPVWLLWVSLCALYSETSWNYKAMTRFESVFRIGIHNIRILTFRIDVLKYALFENSHFGYQIGAPQCLPHDFLIVGYRRIFKSSTLGSDKYGQPFCVLVMQFVQMHNK